MEENAGTNLTEYINIQSDFGFKFVFGNRKNKGAIIRFLNVIFAGKLTVTDVVFHDKEILPAFKDGKRIIYDVYCTSPLKREDSPYFPADQTKADKANSDANHHFILEMQNINTPPFEERLTYYTCKGVAGQGVSGWNYELEPVFTVAVTNFNFNHLSPRLLHDMVIMDSETHETLTDKFHIILCSLQEVHKTWEECKSELEKALYLIKNMENMSSESLAYREGNFSEFFEAARSSRLSKDDIIPYKQSLEYLHEVQRGIDYAKEQAAQEAHAKGLAQGIAQGIAQGMDKGRKEERIIMAANLKALNIDPETIAKASGLSVDQIRNL